MRHRECNLCKDRIPANDGVSFYEYDLCIECIALVRRAICKKCKGSGKIQIEDETATMAQATCGENRIQYKTITCKACE